MKAPNGKPTKLTEEQWVWVKTPNFKKWFGDWEALAEINSFDLNAAKERLQDLIHHQEEVLTADGVKLLFRGQAKKAWSKKAEHESDNSAAHWAAVGNIDELCRRAVQLWEEKPRNGSTDIRAYVKYGAVFTFGDERYIAKITTKAYPEQESQNFYSVESVAVEKIIAHGIHKTITKGQPLDASDENKVSNLIDSVKSVSKVVDENGEPLVVYRGDNKNHTKYEWANVFHATNEDTAASYGEVVQSNFINARNPLIVDTDGAEWLSIDTPSELKSRFEDGEEMDDGRGFTISFDEMSMSVRDMAMFAKKAGYDALIVKNVQDSNEGEEIITDDIVTFSPTQIKSATDNIGTYSQRSDIRWSIQSLPDGRKYVNIDVEQHRFERVSKEDLTKVAKKIIKEKFNRKVIGEKPHNAYVKSDGIEEYIYPAKYLNTSSIEFEAKMKLSTELDNAMLVGEFIGNTPDDGRHVDAVGGWDNYRVIFRLANQFLIGEIKIKITNKGRVFYGISQIKNATDSIRDLLGEIPAIPSISDTQNVPQPSADVKRYSAPVLFTTKGLESALKKRCKHKRVLHVLDELINTHIIRDLSLMMVRKSICALMGNLFILRQSV